MRVLLGLFRPLWTPQGVPSREDIRGSLHRGCRIPATRQGRVRPLPDSGFKVDPPSGLRLVFDRECKVGQCMRHIRAGCHSMGIILRRNTRNTRRSRSSMRREHS